MVVNNAGVALSGRLRAPDLRRHGWIVSISFWGVVHGTEGVPAAPDRLGRQARRQHLVALRAGVDARGSRCTTRPSTPCARMSEALREEMLIAGPGGRHDRAPAGSRPPSPATRASPVRVEGGDGRRSTKLARMEPERAAEIIVAGVLKNRARVLVGIDAHAVHHFARLTGSLPGQWSRGCRRRCRRSLNPLGMMGMVLELRRPTASRCRSGATGRTGVRRRLAAPTSTARGSARRRGPATRGRGCRSTPTSTPSPCCRPTSGSARRSTAPASGTTRTST